MLEMTCHRCGSDRLDVAGDALDWDEVRCRECSEFVTTYGDALAAGQPLPLIDACLKAHRLACTMGIDGRSVYPA